MKTRRIKHSVALFALSAWLSGACLAEDNTRESSLRTSELTRFDANVKGDTDALEKLLDVNLEYSHSNGKLDNRSSFIASISDGTLSYLAIKPYIRSLRLFGDVGVIRGEARVAVKIDGKVNEFTIGYSDVWLWKDGRWQMTEWRSTRLPEAPPK